jgi:hypothetical protein
MRAGLYRMLDANFHEKALFVKAGVAAPRGRAQRLLPFAMLPSALSVSLLFGDSVHRMRSVLVRTNQVLQSSDRFLLVEGGPSSHSAVTFRSETIGQEAVLSTTFMVVAAVPGPSPPLWLLSLLHRFSLSGLLLLLLLAPMRVVERFVGLSSNPQTV